MPLKVYRSSLQINQTDSPSFTQLEVVTVDISYRPSFAELRNAIRLLNSYVQDEIVIPRPYSQYDCTGQSFTSHIELIKKEVMLGYDLEGIEELHKLVAIYTHNISVDV